MLLPTELEGRTHLITLIRLLLSDYYYQITIISLTKNFDHTEIRTLDRRVFSTMLLPTELEGRTHLINLIRLLLSDYFYRINKKFWTHRGSNSQPSRF